MRGLHVGAGIDGERIEITVWTAAECARPDWTVAALGSDFEPSTTYNVFVNGEWGLSFTTGPEALP